MLIRQSECQIQTLIFWAANGNQMPTAYVRGILSGNLSYIYVNGASMIIRHSFQNKDASSPEAQLCNQPD